MLPVIYLVIALVSAFIRVIIIKRDTTGLEKVRIFLLYLIVMCIGVQGILAFYAHAFMADFVAEQIGWAPGSPFQFEMAIANLSYGILGFMCIRFKGNFWIAVVTGNLILLLGAAYGHFVQMAKGDHSPYNSGIFLYVGDIIIPIVIFILMIYYFVSLNKIKKEA
jgi:hypothetical protein